MLKKIGNVLVFLWMVVIKLCRAVFARNKAGANKSTNTNNWKVKLYFKSAETTRLLVI